MSTTYYLGLCAIAKDETPFLREWVGFHYSIGFEKIYIYDNDSNIPIRDTIAEFYNLGICDSYTLSGSGMQLVAYNHCLKHHGDEFEWLAFFDLDEFLCLKSDSDARTLLRDYENYSALALNWDVFSSSGHIKRPQGLVIENYTQSLGYDNICKCIVKPAKVKMPFTAHHFIFTDGIAVNADFQPTYGMLAPIAVDKVCLNHYVYRSQEDYEIKTYRSDASYGEYNPRSMQNFYEQTKAPVEEHSAILSCSPELKIMLKTKLWHQRQDITLAQLMNMPFHTIISLLGKLMTFKQFVMAEVVYSLGYKSFQHDDAYFEFGILISRKTGKVWRALALAREYIAKNSCPESYIWYLECLCDSKEWKEAHTIYDFLKKVVLYEENIPRKKMVSDSLNKYSDWTFLSANDHLKRYLL